MTYSILFLAQIEIVPRSKHQNSSCHLHHQILLIVKAAIPLDTSQSYLLQSKLPSLLLFTVLHGNQRDPLEVRLCHTLQWLLILTQNKIQNFHLSYHVLPHPNLPNFFLPHIICSHSQPLLVVQAKNRDEWLRYEGVTIQTVVFEEMKG